MADTEDDQWDVNEENLLIGSHEILANDHFDHDSSSATSYSASVTNSPAADLHRRSADLVHRRLSIDQLTEEAEADLANNNDPNNNSSNNDGDQPDQQLQHDRNLVQQQQQQLLLQQQDDSDVLLQKLFEESIDADKARDEQIQADLGRDTNLILKLMPDKSYDEVRSMLEAHVDNPSRVQLVLNEFLEEAEDPEEDVAPRRREPSPVQVRNKVGNGMRCKNSKAKSSSTTPSATATTQIAESSSSSSGAPGSSKSMDIWANLASDEASEEGGVVIKEKQPQKRKKPLLDLNMDDDGQLPDDEDFEPSTSRGTTSKVPRLDVGSALVEADNEAMASLSASSSSSSSKPESSRPKIQLSEDHLHGPFNFSAHRPRKSRSKASPSSSSSNHISFKALREDLKDIIEAKESSSNGRNGKKTPTLVDLSGSPPIVDLSQSDAHEVRELYNNLVSMFPTTPKEYLEEMSEDLAGKPAAIERFITELLTCFGNPPDYWKPKVTAVKAEPLLEVEEGIIEPAPIVNLTQGGQGLNMTMHAMEDQDQVVEEEDIPFQHFFEPKPGPSTQARVNETIDLTDNNQNEAAAADTVDAQQPSTSSSSSFVETEEDRANKRLETLVTLFPQTDPEFLHEKAVEFGDNEEQMNHWIEESLENNTAASFPSRKDYEKRQQEAELLEKYSGQVTVAEILDMYNDPEAYFMDKTRQVSELYKKHSLNQLKKEFRHISVQVINKIFSINNSLFVPCVRALKKYSGVKRKTRRPDHECPMPAEIDINFLKELQYSRKEDEVRQFVNKQKEEHEKKVATAKEQGALMECVCCYNDECLDEDMLPCSGGHLFCKECVQRASEVAIGEGKSELACLGQCDELFALSTLQKALKANTFSKWLSRIQLAEIEKADIDGLEQCPFCPFATIMDTTPEENKIFTCLNPHCGKESCRLCKEISHIPLRCEEVEKDAEVRKRTYIENKMTEALIRKCWKCSKPFVKQDGCNKMTCPDCGAVMCYLCRQPVRDYGHFYGQGGVPQPGKECPLWSDNNVVHERDVARGALEAKSEMDKQNPEVKLKHDPAKDINLALANAGQQNPPGFPPNMLDNIPPGILPDDPRERLRVIREQQRIEALIRGGDRPQFNHMMGLYPPPIPPNLVGQADHLHRRINHNMYDVNGFVHRMGELLQLREAQRQQNRAIRRREEQVLEEFQIHRIAHPNQQQDGQVAAQGAAQADPAVQLPANNGLLGPPPRIRVHAHVNIPPYVQEGQRPPRANPLPAHRVQPAPPIPPPPPAHGGREIPPYAHQPAAAAAAANHQMYPQPYVFDHHPPHRLINIRVRDNNQAVPPRVRHGFMHFAMQQHQRDMDPMRPRAIKMPRHQPMQLNPNPAGPIPFRLHGQHLPQNQQQQQQQNQQQPMGNFQPLLQNPQPHRDQVNRGGVQHPGRPNNNVPPRPPPPPPNDNNLFDDLLIAEPAIAFEDDMEM